MTMFLFELFLKQDISREIQGISSEVRTWNPFNDAQPFSQMSEDHIFGAEFDRIRRGSQSSKFPNHFTVFP